MIKKGEEIKERLKAEELKRINLIKKAKEERRIYFKNFRKTDKKYDTLTDEKIEWAIKNKMDIKTEPDKSGKILTKVKIRNPNTGRDIDYNGQTHKDLIKEGIMQPIVWASFVFGTHKSENK